MGPIKSISSLIEGDGKVISHSANQSIRPYGSNQEYLYAMREDLADWLKSLYAVEINCNNFFDELETGTLLCQHANNITTCAEYMAKNNLEIKTKYEAQRPSLFLQYNQGRYVRASSFFARDNIASFINWCRHQLHIPESVMFETNDLVLRYSEKNVILCLLEVARRGSKFGVPAPVLVQMEEDIDREIEMDKQAKQQNVQPKKPVKQRVNCDFKSLDEMVQYILGMCTCPSQFPMVRVADGKYKVGDSENLIFMRILRQHVMVRVGGGWDTLEHYLNKHDPCRCQRHRVDKAGSPRHHNRASSLSSANEELAKDVATPRVKSSSSARLSGSQRLSQSYSNITDIATNRTEKSSPAKLKPQLSMPAHNILNDKKVFAKKTPQSSPRKCPTPRTSKNKPVEDVFSRLSRPKSPASVHRRDIVEQDDLLMVRRNQTGDHRIQRKSTSNIPSNNKSATVVKPARHSVDNNPTVDRRASRGPAQRRAERSQTPSGRRSMEPSESVSGRRSAQGRLYASRQLSVPSANGKTQRSRTLSTEIIPAVKNSNSTIRGRKSKDTTNDQISQRGTNIVDREMEMLKTFEKECLRNQNSLLHSMENIHSNNNNNNQNNEEDNEVAQHMSPSPPARRRHSSLPRPRKDSSSQHEKRTRIPTPVSFRNPLKSTSAVSITTEHNSSSANVLADLNKQFKQQESHSAFRHIQPEETAGLSNQQQKSYDNISTNRRRSKDLSQNGGQFLKEFPTNSIQNSESQHQKNNTPLYSANSQHKYVAQQKNPNIQSTYQHNDNEYATSDSQLTSQQKSHNRNSLENQSERTPLDRLSNYLSQQKTNHGQNDLQPHLRPPVKPTTVFNTQLRSSTSDDNNNSYVINGGQTAWNNGNNVTSQTSQNCDHINGALNGARVSLVDDINVHSRLPDHIMKSCGLYPEKRSQKSRGPQWV